MSVLASFRLSAEESAKQLEAAKLKKKKPKRKPAGSKEKRKRKHKFCVLADGGSDDSSEQQLTSKQKKVSSSMPGGNAARTAARPSAKGSGAAASSSAAAANDSADADAAAVEAAKNGRGPPSKDPMKMAAKIWEEFKVADEHSTYFSRDSSKAQKQFVVRWSNALRTKVNGMEGPARAAAEDVTKRVHHLRLVRSAAWFLHMFSAQCLTIKLWHSRGRQGANRMLLNLACSLFARSGVLGHFVAIGYSVKSCFWVSWSFSLVQDSMKRLAIVEQSMHVQRHWQTRTGSVGILAGRPPQVFAKTTAVSRNVLEGQSFDKFFAWGFLPGSRCVPFVTYFICDSTVKLPVASD
jgi:hypothetical protein